ncbi:uncharacterized protein LOC135201233 [Macrobrachium nipponense]|uniref:uncharacterized protein LOC135201233 n=1 Tax=Macrobrachium nipponense TaxID=159736 RepID=UPI0030C7A380
MTVSAGTFVTQTIQAIEVKFYWPILWKAAKAFIASYPMCQITGNTNKVIFKVPIKDVPSVAQEGKEAEDIPSGPGPLKGTIIKMPAPSASAVLLSLEAITPGLEDHNNTEVPPSPIDRSEGTVGLPTSTPSPEPPEEDISPVMITSPHNPPHPISPPQPPIIDADESDHEGREFRPNISVSRYKLFRDQPPPGELTDTPTRVISNTSASQSPTTSDCPLPLANPPSTQIISTFISHLHAQSTQMRSSEDKSAAGNSSGAKHTKTAEARGLPLWVFDDRKIVPSLSPPPFPSNHPLLHRTSVFPSPPPPSYLPQPTLFNNHFVPNDVEIPDELVSGEHKLLT